MLIASTKPRTYLLLDNCLLMVIIPESFMHKPDQGMTSDGSRKWQSVGIFSIPPVALQNRSGFALALRTVNYTS